MAGGGGQWGTDRMLDHRRDWFTQFSLLLSLEWLLCYGLSFDLATVLWVVERERGREREGEREGDREGERERERGRGRQGGRERETGREKETGRDKER